MYREPISRLNKKGSRKSKNGDTAFLNIYRMSESNYSFSNMKGGSTLKVQRCLHSLDAQIISLVCVLSSLFVLEIDLLSRRLGAWAVQPKKNPRPRAVCAWQPDHPYGAIYSFAHTDFSQSASAPAFNSYYEDKKSRIPFSKALKIGNEFEQEVGSAELRVCLR